MNSAHRTIVYLGESTDLIENVIDSLAVYGHDTLIVSPLDMSPLAAMKDKVGVVLVEISQNHPRHEAMLADVRRHLQVESVPCIAVVDNSIEATNSINSGQFAEIIFTNDDTATNVQKILVALLPPNTELGLADIDITPHEVKLSRSGVRVFIVEDDPLLKNLLGSKFDRASFPYEFNTNGIGVVSAASRFRPDIIILDLMLPGISGFKVLEEIKNDEQLRTVPVLIFSNRDGHEDKERAKALGASAFYVKAMTDLSELIAKIEELARPTAT